MSEESKDILSPEEAIEAMRNNEISEDTAYRILLEAANGYIFAAIRRRIGEVSSSELGDVAAQVWVEVVRSLHKYDLQKGKFTTWVYRIASFRAIDLTRKLGNAHPTISIDADSEGNSYQELYADPRARSPLEEVATKEEIFEALKALVREIDGVDYDIYMLRLNFGDALTFSQIRDLVNTRHGTDLSQKAVESRFYRAKEKLQNATISSC